ncbi:MAG: hypothetical protein ACE3L7_32855 [Candidatus Pristimantibacillus sp.]
MGQYEVVKTEDGYTVDLGDGTSISVSQHEIDNSIEKPVSKFNWKSALQNARTKLQIPKPIRALMFLRTEEERLNYLKSMPSRSVESLTTAIAYVLLKGDILERVVGTGIAIPQTVSTYIKEIDSKAKQYGELTVKNVKKAIQTTKNIVGATAVVLFGIALLTNPAVLTFLLPTLLAADVLWLFINFSDKKHN